MKISHKTAIGIIVFSLGLLVCASAFTGGSEDIDTAYLNARKGYVWALNSLKTKKPKAENKLIENDQLLAVVKVEKEINGIRIITKGYDRSTEVTITAYRTFETLLKEGFIDKNYLPKPDDD